MRIETVAVHAGKKVELESRAVAPSIHLSTTFERDPDGTFPHGFSYARADNPNRQTLEKCLAALEGGTDAVAFSSGSAASITVFQALFPGDHVIAPLDTYHGTSLQLRGILTRRGLKVSFADMTDLPAVDRAVTSSTKIVWVETPSNPLLRIVDIKEVSNLAHAVGAVCVCDNTWATPILQRPLELGADLVVHATTKYLGEHSDVMGGAVVSKSDSHFFQSIRKIQAAGGAVPSPFDCWLIRRGACTLPWRMKAHSE